MNAYYVQKQVSQVFDGTGDIIPLVFSVESRQNPGYHCIVDLQIGTCSVCCLSQGTCPHLAVAARESGYAGHFIAPTFDPYARHQCIIALGAQAPPLEAFADLHQKSHEREWSRKDIGRKFITQATGPIESVEDVAMEDYVDNLALLPEVPTERNYLQENLEKLQQLRESRFDHRRWTTAYFRFALGKAYTHASNGNGAADKCKNARTASSEFRTSWEFGQNGILV